MNDAVLDASVVLKWFRADGERHVKQALALRGLFQHGKLGIVVPPLLGVETLNVAARGWGLNEQELVEFVRTLERFRFDVREPDLEEVARWASRGLSAYDATYVALAEAEELPLVTDDDELMALAPLVARPLRDQPEIARP